MQEIADDDDLADELEAMWNASEVHLTDSTEESGLGGLAVAGDLDGPWAEMAWCLYSTMRWQYLP